MRPEVENPSRFKLVEFAGGGVRQRLIGIRAPNGGHRSLQHRFICMKIAVTLEDGIHFITDDSRNIIFTTARGIVTKQDVLKYIRAKIEKGFQRYAELFDARDIVLDLSANDLPAIADAMRDSVLDQVPPKIAVVTNSAFVYGMAKKYAEISQPDNPSFEVFGSVDDARRWLRVASTAF
jgi:hypothetical protein